MATVGWFTLWGAVLGTATGMLSGAAWVIIKKRIPATGLAAPVETAKRNIAQERADEELCAQAEILIRRLREYETRTETERRLLDEEYRNQMYIAKDAHPAGEARDKAMSAVGRKETEAASRLSNDHSREFRTTLASDTQRIQKALLARLPGEPELPRTHDAYSLFKWGQLSGSYPVSAAANYLEQLKRKLCP
jgi:hypothetical protein